jgi:hypothetical protein
VIDSCGEVQQGDVLWCAKEYEVRLSLASQAGLGEMPSGLQLYFNLKDAEAAPEPLYTFGKGMSYAPGSSQERPAIDTPRSL